MPSTPVPKTITRRKQYAQEARNYVRSRRGASSQPDSAVENALRRALRKVLWIMGDQGMDIGLEVNRNGILVTPRAKHPI